MHRPTAKINCLETDFLATNGATSLTLAREERSSSHVQFFNHVIPNNNRDYQSFEKYLKNQRFWNERGRLYACSTPNIKRILYISLAHLININMQYTYMHHQYVYSIHLYSKKRIFTLIDTYMYKIVLQTLFGSRHTTGYINLYRRVCTDRVCVNAGR